MYVNWAITSKCNLDCLHCRGMEKQQLDNTQAKKVIDDLTELGPEWVTIDGGEPLLRNDLFELLEYAREKLQVFLVSNATLLDEGKIKRLADLGVKVEISLDGADPKTYREVRGACFSEVKEAARLCGKKGILEAICFVLMKQTYQQAGKIIQLAEELGSRRVMLLGLKPPAGNSYEPLLLDEGEYEKAFFEIAEQTLNTNIEVFVEDPFFIPFVKHHNLEVNLSGEQGQDNGILVDEPGCAFGKYLFIEPNGRAKPCTFSPVSFGNVSEEPVGEVWGKITESQLVKEMDEKSECRQCSYFEECKGCRVRSYHLGGGWHAKDPVCPLEG